MMPNFPFGESVSARPKAPYNVSQMFQQSYVEAKAISSQKTAEPEDFTDNRIYVSNIPFSFVEGDLAKLFSRYGVVVDVQIVKNERGSKGFGFVTLDNQEGCVRARSEMHGAHIQGRVVEVRRATPARRINRLQPATSLTLERQSTQLSPSLIPNLEPLLQAAEQQLLSNLLCNGSTALTMTRPLIAQLPTPFIVPPMQAGGQQLLNPISLNGFANSQLAPKVPASPPSLQDYCSFVPQTGFPNGVAIVPQSPGFKPPASPRTPESGTSSMLGDSFAAHAWHTQLMEEQLTSLLSLDVSTHEDMKQRKPGSFGSMAPSPPLAKDAEWFSQTRSLDDVLAAWNNIGPRTRHFGKPFDDSFSKLTHV